MYQGKATDYIFASRKGHPPDTLVAVKQHSPLKGHSHGELAITFLQFLTLAVIEEELRRSEVIHFL